MLASLGACTYDFDQFSGSGGRGPSTTTSGGGAVGSATGRTQATSAGTGGAPAGTGGGGSAGAGGSALGGSGGVALAGAGGSALDLDGGDSGPTSEDDAADGAGIVSDVEDRDTTNDATAPFDAPQDVRSADTVDASNEGVATDGATPDASDAAVEGASDAACVGDACLACTDSTECSCASYNGHAYRFCTTARSRIDSETRCTTAGMRLARVDDALENAWIRSTADARAMAETWIGVEDPTKTLHWQWPDGAQFWTGTSSGSSVGGLYNAWSPNNPTGAPVRNCASMLGGSGQWTDRSCTSLLPYVCELY